MKKTDKQSWNPDQYAENARFVSDLGMPVVDLLAPQAGERILDLGCGDGPLTKKLANLGCRVIGVDASAPMIEAAGKLGLDARVMDGHELTFDGEFDAVFTNAALHWMKQTDKVIDGVWRALKPGGRFVGECGGAGNVATIVKGLEVALAKRGIDARPLNPWVFHDTETFSGLLQARGFKVESIALIPRPTPLPGNVVGWLETFAQNFTASLSDVGRAELLQEVAEFCRPTFCGEDGVWVADYVRLRFSAQKSA